MNNADLPGKPSKFSQPQVDDIPEALREAPSVSSRPRLKLHPLLWGLVGLAIALAAGVILNWQSQMPFSPQQATASQSAVQAESGIQQALVEERAQIPSSLLGHLPYEEAPPETLQSIVADGSIQLRQAAAEQFTAMVNAAQADNVVLVPISGFRSIADQEYLFFDLKAQQGERAAERAEVSAPPGYSEHHTGYAVDILDGDELETDLDVSFEKTKAFRWLKDNAAYYSFELSFPRNNRDGVSFEPWHWRYVGDRHSLETFYQARQPLSSRSSSESESVQE